MEGYATLMITRAILSSVQSYILIVLTATSTLILSPRLMRTASLFLGLSSQSRSGGSFGAFAYISLVPLTGRAAMCSV